MKLRFHMGVEMVRPKYKFAPAQLCMKGIHGSVSPLTLHIREKTCRFESDIDKVLDQVV